MNLILGAVVPLFPDQSQAHTSPESVSIVTFVSATVTVPLEPLGP